jgi:hypothetical protein
MNSNSSHDDRIGQLTFSSVYPHYVNKIQKKGRTIEELHKVISWLTGFSESQLAQQIKENVTFAHFFDQANLHPNAHLITGTICGYRIETIENSLTRKIRYLDKLVDELAKGRKLDKILR